MYIHDKVLETSKKKLHKTTENKDEAIIILFEFSFTSIPRNPRTKSTRTEIVKKVQKFNVILPVVMGKPLVEEIG